MCQIRQLGTLERRLSLSFILKQPTRSFKRHLKNMMVNSSEHPSPWLINSTQSPIRSFGFGMSCFTMTFGAISNVTALGILVKSYVQFRRQSKAPFLLLTVALLFADLGSHVIPGAFALYLHMDQKYEMQADKPTTFCQIFGASMVFFGLSPLLLGCAMAMERYVAITRPFFHAAMITVTHVQLTVIFLSSLALMLAVLPLFGIGTYTTHFPDTWCFLPIHKPHSTADSNLALAFSCLGLIALTVSLLCNILSGLALLQARKQPHKDYTKPSTRYTSSVSTSPSPCSLDVEMMVQLAVVTVISCVCWSPFLIHMLQNIQSPRPSNYEQDGFTLLSLRMASWNQILDPWVYILLRRGVLSRLCCAFYTRRPSLTANSFRADKHRRPFSLQ